MELNRKLCASFLGARGKGQGARGKRIVLHLFGIVLLTPFSNFFNFFNFSNFSNFFNFSNLSFGSYKMELNRKLCAMRRK